MIWMKRSWVFWGCPCWWVWFIAFPWLFSPFVSSFLSEFLLPSILFAMSYLWFEYWFDTIASVQTAQPTLFRLLSSRLFLHQALLCLFVFSLFLCYFLVAGWASFRSAHLLVFTVFSFLLWWFYFVAWLSLLLFCDFVNVYFSFLCRPRTRFFLLFFHTDLISPFLSPFIESSLLVWVFMYIPMYTFRLCVSLHEFSSNRLFFGELCH